MTQATDDGSPPSRGGDAGWDDVLGDGIERRLSPKVVAQPTSGASGTAVGPSHTDAASTRAGTDRDEDGNGWVYVVALTALAVAGFFMVRPNADAGADHGAGHAVAGHEADAVESSEADEAEGAKAARSANFDASAAKPLPKPPIPRPVEPAAAVDGTFGASTVPDPKRAEVDAAVQAAAAAAAESEGDTEETGDGAPEVEGESALEDAETPPAPSGDPRAVPSGTKPANAKAFAKLPVAGSDGPPLGGVGANGIHVDLLDVGAEYENRACAGAKTAFSISKGQKANACFRIVHQREEEEVVVQWMKDGKLARRSKVNVPNAHAYKGRAALALREDYAGNWTVRIVSSDGVELGKANFTVVE